MTSFIQQCIAPDCQAEYQIGERLYVCSRCGGLLDVVSRDLRVDVASLRELWQGRKTSLDVRDRSGVWRFREFLPFAEDAEVVSLGEGTTPLYEAPRSADYCRLTHLKLKHQGCNPTGSFKDTGMTVAVTQARKLGARFPKMARCTSSTRSIRFALKVRRRSRLSLRSSLNGGFRIISCCLGEILG